jgi:hypothetical protein
METPLRDLNYAWPRLHRSRILALQRGRLQPKLAKKAYYHHHQLQRIFLTSSSPERTPTAHVGQTSSLLFSYSSGYSDLPAPLVFVLRRVRIPSTVVRPRQPHQREGGRISAGRFGSDHGHRGLPPRVAFGPEALRGSTPERGATCIKRGGTVASEVRLQE